MEPAFIRMLLPARWLAAPLLAGVALEAALLLAGGAQPFAQGPLVAGLALLFLAGTWLAFGWLLGGLGVGLARARAHGPWAGRAFQAASAAALAAALLVHALSWGLYLRTGKFADLEVIRYGLVNLDYIARQVRLLEPLRLLLLGLGLGAVVAGLELAVARLAAPREGPPDLHRRRAALVVVLVLAGSVAHLLIGLDASEQRRGLRLDVVRNRLHPASAVVHGALEALLGEGVPATLDPAELVPRAAAAAWTPPPPAGPPPHVLIIEVESLRPDVIGRVHQGRAVMPTVDALVPRSRVFTRAYAVSTHSDYSDPSLISGLYPLWSPEHHYYRLDDPWPRVRLYDLLGPAGWATAVISSGNERWGGMDRFYESPHLELHHHAELSDAATRLSRLDTGFAGEVAAGVLRSGNVDDATTMDLTIAWVEAQLRAGRPLCLRLNLQYSHFPYELPDDAPRPFQPCAIDFPASFLAYPRDKVEVVRNAYYNALHAIDAQLARLLAVLERAGALERSILLIAGENGEAFHERGQVTHAGGPFEPAVRVGALLHAPGRVTPGVDDYPVALVDVVPTILGLLGWPPHPGHQGIDVLARDRPPLAERTLYFHTQTGLARMDAVLAAGRWKLLHDRDAGTRVLYDLAQDPREEVDLSAARPELFRQLSAHLAEFRRRQLSYYRHPAYHLQAFPPAPPRLRLE